MTGRIKGTTCKACGSFGVNAKLIMANVEYNIISNFKSSVSKEKPMTNASALDWQEHITAGRKYLKTAGNGLARPAVFNNDLIYQLTAMAVEKMLVGVFQYYRKMPADHSLDGLVDELALLCPLDKGLADRVKFLGRFDDMCPLVPVNRSIPTDREIKTILAVGQQVAAFADRQVLRPVLEREV